MGGESRWRSTGDQNGCWPTRGGVSYGCDGGGRGPREIGEKEEKDNERKKGREKERD